MFQVVWKYSNPKHKNKDIRKLHVFTLCTVCFYKFIQYFYEAITFEINNCHIVQLVCVLK